MNIPEDSTIQFQPVLPPGRYIKLKNRWAAYGATYEAVANRNTSDPGNSIWELNHWGPGEIETYIGDKPDTYPHSDYPYFYPALAAVPNIQEQFCLRAGAPDGTPYTEDQIFRARYWAWIIGTMYAIELAIELRAILVFGSRGRIPNRKK